jgi:hypothetical protein
MRVGEEPLLSIGSLRVISFQCPKCQAALKRTDDGAGLLSKCPKCGSSVQVPRPTAGEEVIEVTPAVLLSKELAKPSPVRGLEQAEVLPAYELKEVQESHRYAKRGFPLWLLAVVIPAGALLLCCAGGIGFAILRTYSPGSKQPTPTDTYIHAPSRFSFPPRVGIFAREVVKQYDREGMDVSVSYNMDPTVAMTVYVYPIPQGGPDGNLDGHFENCKREVLSRHQRAELVSEAALTVAPGGQRRPGKHATFTFTERFARREQAVRSELYLFAFGTWFIKYRVTYPVGQQAKAEPIIKTFIEELSWPEEDKR